LAIKSAQQEIENLNELIALAQQYSRGPIGIKSFILTKLLSTTEEVVKILL